MRLIWVDGKLEMQLFSFTQNLRRYDNDALRGDLQAGLTVAVVAIPQTMAYAMLAGVAPVYGLYAAIIMASVAAWWGSSRFLNTGPTNTAALLTAAALAPLAPVEDKMALVCVITLLVGLMRLLMGLARFGQLADFVPESALLGFTVGAGILIALGQLHHLLGVPPPAAPSCPGRFLETLGAVPGADPAALLTGLFTLAVMFFFGKRARRFPAALLAIGLAALAARFLEGVHPLRTVRDLAALPRGWPELVFPHAPAEVWIALLPSALAIAVIGLIEAASIGQVLALRHQERIDLNREFTAQGLSQILAAFFGAIPGSGSFSRSRLVEQSGGRTRLAHLYFSLAIAALLLLAPGILEWIPVASLAGLLIYIGLRLVDIHRIQRVFSTSATDTVILLLTFFITVFGRIEYGIFAGVAGAALVHLQRARELRLVEYLPDGPGRLEERPYEPGAVHPAGALVAVGVSGDLFYGLSMALRDQLRAIIETQQPRHLVIRVRRAYSIDYSCWSVLFDLADAFQGQGGRVYLCGVRPDYQRIIRQAGMESVLPEGQIFPATRAPFEAFANCLRALPGLPPVWSAYLRAADRAP